MTRIDMTVNDKTGDDLEIIDQNNKNNSVKQKTNNPDSYGHKAK